MKPQHLLVVLLERGKVLAGLGELPLLHTSLCARSPGFVRVDREKCSQRYFKPKLKNTDTNAQQDRRGDYTMSVSCRVAFTHVPVDERALRVHQIKPRCVLVSREHKQSDLCVRKR